MSPLVISRQGAADGPEFEFMPCHILVAGEILVRLDKTLDRISHDVSKVVTHNSAQYRRS